MSSRMVEFNHTAPRAIRFSCTLGRCLAYAFLNGDHDIFDSGAAHEQAMLAVQDLYLIIYIVPAAAFLLSEAVLPSMPKGDASIIHISSTRAIQSEPNSEVRFAACNALHQAHHRVCKSAKQVCVGLRICKSWFDWAYSQSSCQPWQTLQSQRHSSWWDVFQILFIS